MDDLRSWPVYVTYTHRHVIWVEAPDHKAAVEHASDRPYEQTDDQETLIEIGWQVAPPKGSFEWEDVYEGQYLMPYQGLQCDAHIETRRRHFAEEDRRYEAAVCEDEDRDGIADDQRRTCALCRKWREPDHETRAWHLMEVRGAEFDARRKELASGLV